MAQIMGLFSFIIGVFFLIAVWRIVMDLPNIVIQLKAIRKLLMELNGEKNSE